VTDAVNPHSGAPESCLPPVYAKVALDTPLDRLFDYLARDATSEDIGRRVEAPFGNRTLVGVLLALSNQTEVAQENLKPLHAIDRTSPPLPPDLLDLARFVADYYHHPLGAVLATMLPPALRRTEQRTRTTKATLTTVYRLTDLGRDAVTQVPAHHTARKKLAERLLNGELATQGLAASERTLLRDWLGQGWIAPAGMAADAAATDAEPQLTDEQAAVLSALRDAGDRFHAGLLHGVTGSGKTEAALWRYLKLFRAGEVDSLYFALPTRVAASQLYKRVQDTLNRLQLKATLKAGDARDPRTWWDGKPFDAILLDAPCTASGIVRRHPDVRWLRRESDIAQLAQVQARLLAALWPMLRPGGRMLYATCSVFKAEGQQQIETFLARNSEASLMPSPGHILPAAADTGHSVPDNGPGGHDGFYYALLQKTKR